MVERAFAPAKVNLYLHVVGRRDDGYHRLDSLVAFAAVGDSISAAAATDFSLTVDGPFAAGVPTGADNLVLRAARALAERAGVRSGAALALDKRLPVASGIGGGSADAAATLRALAALWRVELARFPELPLGLGADVPVCLHGKPVFMGGIGEELTPAPALPPVWLVLVNPGVAVSTPAVFRRRAGPFSAPARFETRPANAADLVACLRERHNDLETPAREATPAVGEALAALTAAPDVLLARMSGSGATCFGVCADEDSARAAAAAIAAARPTWWVVASPLIGER